MQISGLQCLDGEPLVRRWRSEICLSLKAHRVSQMHSPDWETPVWQVLENLISSKVPASQEGRFSATPPHPRSFAGDWLIPAV